MRKQKSSFGKKHILLLEDEEVLGALYVKQLESEGFKVFWFRSAEELAKEAGRLRVDLILLDHAIRGEERSGMEMAFLLRKMGQKAPIFILSNYDQFQLEGKDLIDQLDFLLKIETPPTILAKKIHWALSR